MYKRKVTFWVALNCWQWKWAGHFYNGVAPGHQTFPTRGSSKVSIQWESCMITAINHLTREVLPAIVSPTGTRRKILQEDSFSFSFLENLFTEMSSVSFRKPMNTVEPWLSKPYRRNTTCLDNRGVQISTKDVDC